jgi:hypothetical protein
LLLKSFRMKQSVRFMSSAFTFVIGPLFKTMICKINFFFIRVEIRLVKSRGRNQFDFGNWFGITGLFSNWFL